MRFKQVTQKTDVPNIPCGGKPWHVRQDQEKSRSYEVSSSPKTQTNTTIRKLAILHCSPDHDREQKARSIQYGSYSKRWQNFEEHIQLDDARIPSFSSPVFSNSVRRMSVALASIVLCMYLLTYMMPLFSSKLRIIEKTLVERNDIFGGSMSSSFMFQSPFGFPMRQDANRRRRLASLDLLTQDHSKKKDRPSLHEELRQGFTSLKLMLSLLKGRKETPTTSVFRTLLNSQPMQSPQSNLFRAADKRDDDNIRALPTYSVRKERQVLPNHLSQEPLGLQIGQRVQRISKHPVAEASPNSIRKNLNSNRANSNPQHTDALNTVGNAVSAANSTSAASKNRNHPCLSKSGDLESSIAQKVSQPFTPHYHIQANEVNGDERHVTLMSEMTFSANGLIEIWMLQSGSSLCRIYNVGRLSEGNIMLPTWMEKHSMVLLHQCGVKNPIFTIKSGGNEKRFLFEKKPLNLSGEVQVITSNDDKDLFSSIAPRHHMPHFVSDILFPLIATEILKGSGNGIRQLKVVRMSSASNSAEPVRTAFRDLRPSLFLRSETWQSNSSTWVQRLARFFSHPGVGFALLSEDDRDGPNKRIASRKSNLVWRFRSVLTSNLNSYEQEELFDAHGNNFVLSQNGLSGAPAWTMKGISQEPCQVTVTALTRRGPRALLRLDALRKTASTLLASRGLQIDFKVVKFENARFDAQVKTMQSTNVLIATHGAGNANLIFLRRGATVIEVFPFAYRAGPFDGLARTFGLEYKTAMSEPQTKIFKECMNRHESKDEVRRKVFGWWDKAVVDEKASPWIHRLELEKEFGEPGKSEGMATRRCVRMQQLAFNIEAVAAMVFESAKRQCNDFRFHARRIRLH